MIPEHITKTHIHSAIQRVVRDGVPARRRSRGYCLVANAEHLPPKYIVALAHEIATGRLLSSSQFSGGSESNEFLRRRGFAIVECDCGGKVNDLRVMFVPRQATQGRPTLQKRRHSERCRECKIRVGQLLERIYGACEANYRTGWQTGLEAYEKTPIGPALRDVAQALDEHRGFGVGTFVRSGVISGCDYWVPNPGFIVEFDESQHFTSPRRLALSIYADRDRLGFPRRRWMELCEHHDARDNDPEYRDEQRAWYDTLRDLVPSIKGLRPTVRLYARDYAWCSLGPENSADRELFLDLMHPERPLCIPSTLRAQTAAVQPTSTRRVALVFPAVAKRSSLGVPPTGAGAQEPDVPTSASFIGESVDLVLFPEGYVAVSDHERTEALNGLASDLGATLLVGGIERRADYGGRTCQVLLRFDPDGFHSRVYTKHSTAKAVAFERPDWEPNDMLPTIELGNVTAGATICHDHYLGLLPRFLAGRGALLWFNPSFDNVREIKWSSVLRLRAVENRFYSLCTLHCDMKGQRTHPFAFAPDGTELSARQAGSKVARPLSECCEAGNIYVVDLDLAAAGEPLDWSKLPPANTPKRTRGGKPRRLIRVALRGGRPTIYGCSRIDRLDSGFRGETVHGPVYAGMVPGAQVLDASECFRAIDQAKQMNCTPIIWNHWERLPTESERLATIMLGRVIECCTPIVISDECGIHELIELSNRNKIPVRRVIEPSGDAYIDLGYAWGLDNAFKMVTKHVPAHMRPIVLDRYRSLSLSRT